jgi:3-methyladenine DNA glycosylase AlkC
MPEPLKDLLFSRETIAAIGAHLAARAPFDRAGFEAAAGEGLEALELKARAAQITRALEAHLPGDFGAACDAMLAALHPETDGIDSAPSDERGLRGWAVMPLADYVAARGLGDFDRSMWVLAEMTKRFSAEFAVRPFIAADPDRALRYLTAWAADPNPHVRRLASEGSRPRLPWGMRLRAFVADPAPLLPVLARLRDDPSETVRRSVANSLNDIAKDHPDLVAALAREWLRDAPPERARLVRHACRTLVKRGHAATLAALGFEAASVRAELAVATPVVRHGEALEFALELRADGGAQRLVVDYAIHHRKANGETAPKVFKWRVVELAPGAELRLERRHRIRPITTRRYYDGPHRVEALVNGRAVASAGFELTGAGRSALAPSGVDGIRRL